MGARLFQSSLDADIILISRQEDDPVQFHVHKCILASASPFFADMFSLPQSPRPSDETHLPIIPMSESRPVIAALLQSIYPVEDPKIDSLDELVPILAAATKYDITPVISMLGKILVSLPFVETEPARVYAIASRFDMEEEAKIASKYTLNVNLLEAPLSDDLKYITAHSYIRLLSLHRRRVDAAVAMLKPPQYVMCIQCNGSAFSVYTLPKWWYEFEKRARVELSARPTTDVIFGVEFLGQAVAASGCTRCPGSVLDSWKFLQELKDAIDQLPSTV